MVTAVSNFRARRQPSWCQHPKDHQWHALDAKLHRCQNASCKKWIRWALAFCFDCNVGLRQLAERQESHVA